MYFLNFSEQLEEAMRIRNITQKQLAERADVNVYSINQFLGGKSVPGTKIRKRLESVLDYKFRPDDPPKLNERNLTVAEAAEMLGKHQQTIRIGIQTGQIPIGVAIKCRGSSKYTYQIPLSRVKAYLDGTMSLI